MKKIALLFPGQGSQYVGMGKKFYQEYPMARSRFAEAGELLGLDLTKLCFEGSLAELIQTENAQPAILTVSMAMFEVYQQEIGIEPQFLAGHSLGEISALTCAGAIRFSDAVKLVRHRGLLMRDAATENEGAMAAVAGIDPAMVEAECHKFNTGKSVLLISNYNSPDQVVISGHKLAVTEVGKILESKGAKVIPLKVSSAFHSPLMQSASKKFTVELKKYNYMPLKWPVISNVTGVPYSESGQIVSLLTEQLTQPVQWQGTITYLQKQGMEYVVELGPQTVLRNLMKSNASQLRAFSYDKEEDVRTLKNEVVFPPFPTVKPGDFQHTVITKCIQIAVCTKNRNCNQNQDEYQKGVVEPYRKVQKMQEELVNSNQSPTLDQMKSALEMLMSVFTTKMTPRAEQIERFNEVFETTGTRQLFPDFIQEYILDGLCRSQN
jgi:[acyl-carrier-protein] S-malonyltransferase